MKHSVEKGWSYRVHFQHAKIFQPMYLFTPTEADGTNLPTPKTAGQLNAQPRVFNFLLGIEPISSELRVNHLTIAPDINGVDDVRDLIPVINFQSHNWNNIDTRNINNNNNNNNNNTNITTFI